jgi:hypothetical protein
MSEIRRKYAKRVRTGMLIIAHLAVVGLQFYYGYYQFFGFSAYRPLYATRLAQKKQSIRPSRAGWDKYSHKALLLDKRFAHEHVWCCPFPFFFLPLRADDPKQAICCSRIHAWTGWLRLFLRGPPDDQAAV